MESFTDGLSLGRLLSRISEGEGNDTRVVFDLDEELGDSVEALAEREGVTVSDLLAELLQDGLLARRGQ